MERSEQGASNLRQTAEYTTPTKSDNTSQVVPSLPVNSEYDKQRSTSNSMREEEGSIRFVLRGDMEMVQESNVEALYTTLCNLENVCLNGLGLEWFSYISQGYPVYAFKDFFSYMNFKLGEETNKLCPNKTDIFTWAKEVGSPKNVKVVILGQDPYFSYVWDSKVSPWEFVPMSDGLGFSINPRYMEIAKKLPEHNSLKNIMKVISPTNVGSESFNWDLRPWAKQGVLLFDVHLTSAAHSWYMKREGGFHSHLGWNFFTDLVIKKLGAEDRPPTVFLLCGESAKEKNNLVSKKHLVIKACHPVCYDMMINDVLSGKLTGNCSCYNFCWMPQQDGKQRNDFEAANTFLEQHGRRGIVWDCFGEKAQLRRKSTNLRENLENSDEDEVEKRCTKGTIANEGDDENVNGKVSDDHKRGLDEHSEESYSGNTKKPKPIEQTFFYTGRSSTGQQLASINKKGLNVQGIQSSSEENFDRRSFL